VKERKLAVTWYRFDNATGTRTPVDGMNGFTIPFGAAAGTDYLLAELRTQDHTGRLVRVYLRGSGSPSVVGVEREW